MATAQDVAEEILRREGSMDTFRLQKLTFYAHAVHLARTHEPLFHGRVEAWTNGPCVVSLYRAHRGWRNVATVHGDESALDAEALRSIEAALMYYGEHDADWLINQTHLEDPWRDAREGTPPGERSDALISDDAILAYYGPIFDDPELDERLRATEDERGLTVDELRSRYAHLS